MRMIYYWSLNDFSQATVHICMTSFGIGLGTSSSKKADSTNFTFLEGNFEAIINT